MRANERIRKLSSYTSWTAFEREVVGARPKDTDAHESTPAWSSRKIPYFQLLTFLSCNATPYSMLLVSNPLRHLFRGDAVPGEESVSNFD